MEYNKLGNSDLRVSKICLGTMTFGEQNSELEAHQQLDYALAHGVNFIDTAEMYPVPPRQQTQGITEAYIGTWLHKEKSRDKVIIASKVAGPGMMDYLRNGAKLVRSQMQQALEESLRRLQTDYIDLYQIHWPARNTNFFGKLGYQYDETNSTPIKETLEVLNDFVESGKIRYIGISNETPWGVMQYLMLSENNSWPRIISIQNPYSLLNRTFEVGLAEFSQREKVDLLAYSPLGFGVLTGKYLQKNDLSKARLTLFEGYTRYSNQQSKFATEKYVALAKKNGLSATQMALAYVNSRPFLSSNIIGATSVDQLAENIDSINVTLSSEVVEGIEAIHRQIPNPSP
ncbi:MAG: NADP(H)-dependent aldo-keto reductase [Gammaproteobacteria bacterium]|nr:NADP(H)-dependent aldo-keto reductase [Gammaproteobacteria bacterium]